MANKVHLNNTNQVVRAASNIVSKDVRAPKAVREGVVKLNFSAHVKSKK